MPRPRLQKSGMPRWRYDQIWLCIRFSDQPKVRPKGISHAHHRWMLIKDFVRNFNSHRADNFVPSDLICVNESMSKWYGQGGNWINHGLPQYVAIDRNPVDGCEIQNIACARSQVMLQLKLVKAAEEDDSHTKEVEVNGKKLNYGTLVVKELLKPWKHSRGPPMIVCGDSYFASVQTVEELALDKF